MEPKDSLPVVIKVSNYKLSYFHWINFRYSYSISARSTLIYRCYLVTSFYVGKLNNLIHSYGNYFSFTDHNLVSPIQSHKGYLKDINAWEQISASLLFLNVNWDYQSVNIFIDSGPKITFNLPAQTVFTLSSHLWGPPSLFIQRIHRGESLSWR